MRWHCLAPRSPISLCLWYCSQVEQMIFRPRVSHICPEYKSLGLPSLLLPKRLRFDWIYVMLDLVLKTYVLFRANSDPSWHHCYTPWYSGVIIVVYLSAFGIRKSFPYRSSCPNHWHSRMGSEYSKGNSRVKLAKLLSEILWEGRKWRRCSGVMFTAYVTKPSWPMNRSCSNRKM